MMLYFERYVDHRYLHSFPTRRSSDLRLVAFGECVDESAREFVDPPAVAYGNVVADLQKPADLAAELRRCGAGVCRSEEHTSELQSREKLVCRLLLEKKKVPQRT